MESALPPHVLALTPPLSLSRQGVALAYLVSLPPHDQVMWTDCSFPFGKDCSGVLVNCSLCATEATLLFDRPSMLQVFPLKSAPFCKLFAGLGSTNKSAISLLLLSDSRHPVLSCIFPFTWISQAEAVFSFFVLTGYNGSPDTRFSWETARLMSWPDGERYLRPPQSPVVSLLLFLVSTLLFSEMEAYNLIKIL